jgi:ribonucleoside-diphosphate reductase alpha chain
MQEYQFPESRHGLTRKFYCGLDVYLTVNLKPDGELGEIFIKLGKPGTTVNGLMQAWSVTISTALKRGVPWEDFREKYQGMRFEPMTHEYTSLIDAVTHNIDQLIEENRKEQQKRIK